MCLLKILTTHIRDRTTRTERRVSEKDRSTIVLIFLLLRFPSCILVSIPLCVLSRVFSSSSVIVEIRSPLLTVWVSATIDNMPTIENSRACRHPCAFFLPHSLSLCLSRARTRVSTCALARKNFCQNAYYPRVFAQIVL